MEKKQTAVEWYNQQLVDRQNGNADSRSWDDIFEEAKQMEMEQINSAHTVGFIIGGGEEGLYEPENYYDNTYGGQDE